MRQSADCQTRPVKAESAAQYRAEQQVHTLGRPQRRLDEAATNATAPKSTTRDHGARTWFTKSAPRSKSRSTGDRDAEHPGAAIAPAVESVLADAPQCAERNQRPVGALVARETDEQGGRETDGRPSGEPCLGRKSKWFQLVERPRPPGALRQNVIEKESRRLMLMSQ